MEYHRLGKSGLEVSRIGLGTIPFGTALDEKAASAIVDRFYDAGGNYIDTANIYGGGVRGRNTEMAGTAERTVGKIIKGKRSRFALATKGGWIMEDDMKPNAFGLSRTYLSTQIEESLRRLDTDYIDLYQCHIQDPYTPVEETMRVLDDFVKSGKIRYVGVSNWGGWQTVKGSMHARQFNLSPIVSNQIWYNIADRVAEFDIIPACRDQNISIIGWGVLAQGFLTGRYSRTDRQPNPTDRIVSNKPQESSSWEQLAVERVWQIQDVLARLGKHYGKSLSSIALAWALQSGGCDVALLGVSNLAELDNGINSLDLRLSIEDLQALQEVSRLPAPYPMNLWNLFCYRDSEFYGGLR